MFIICFIVYIPLMHIILKSSCHVRRISQINLIDQYERNERVLYQTSKIRVYNQLWIKTMRENDAGKKKYPQIM